MGGGGGSQKFNPDDPGSGVDSYGVDVASGMVTVGAVGLAALGMSDFGEGVVTLVPEADGFLDAVSTVVESSDFSYWAGEAAITAEDAVASVFTSVASTLGVDVGFDVSAVAVDASAADIALDVFEVLGMFLF